MSLVYHKRKILGPTIPKGAEPWQNFYKWSKVVVWNKTYILVYPSFFFNKNEVYIIQYQSNCNWSHINWIGGVSHSIRYQTSYSEDETYKLNIKKYGLFGNITQMTTYNVLLTPLMFFFSFIFLFIQQMTTKYKYWRHQTGPKIMCKWVHHTLNCGSVYFKSTIT